MTPRRRPQSINRVELQEKLLVVIDRFHGNVGLALNDLGIAPATYRRWRERYPEFKQRFDVARAHARQAATGEMPRWEEGFAAFRLAYFRNESPWVHLKIIEAYEQTRPGNITMILVPPESGKTSLFEDYASMTLAVDPNHSFTVGSESLPLSQKILGKIQERMDPEVSPYFEFIRDYGPFIPQENDDRARAQTWNTKAFNVAKRSGGIHREFSMQALGFGAKIAGTRTRHLHCDDMQSVVSLNRTEDFVRRFRQDWLTRPGENAPTTINATRVGEGDMYGVLEETIDPTILSVIRFPAIITRINELGEQVTEPLIPRDDARNFGWTMEQLERIRAKVGEEAWANNYMQNPKAVRNTTFTEELIGECFNPLRSVHHGCEPGEVLYFSLDPAIGSTTAIAAAAVTAERIKLLDLVGVNGLMRNEDIMAEVERMVARYVRQGGYATELIIEAKNFQAGLSRDERLLEICEKFGMSAREHLTDVNKYDENIGVSSMTHTFRKGQFDIPWASDDETRTRMQLLRDELLAWKPLKRGNKLRQDRVMALWFLWIFWRERKGERYETTSTIKRNGMPYAPTRAGLLVPAGRR